MSSHIARFAALMGSASLAVVAAGCSSSSTADPAGSSGPTSSVAADGSPGPSSSLVSGARGWIAYQTTDGAFDRVHLVRSDGTDDHAIGARLPGRTAHPDFSPDGRRLVIDELPSESAADQLYVGNGNGRHLRQIAACRPQGCFGRWEAAWSPDSRHLAISTYGGRPTDTSPSRFGLSVVPVTDLATSRS